MSELMALHEKFADQGLVIIAIQRDWGVASVEDWQAHALRREDWGNRALPFRIALDGGGPTPIEGTDAKGPGATHAAFGVQDESPGLAAFSPSTCSSAPTARSSRAWIPPGPSSASWRRGWASRRSSPPGACGSIRSTHSPTARSSNASGHRILPSGPTICSTPRAAGGRIRSVARSFAGTGDCVTGGAWGSVACRMSSTSSSSFGAASSTGPPIS